MDFNTGYLPANIIMLLKLLLESGTIAMPKWRELALWTTSAPKLAANALGQILSWYKSAQEW